MADTSVCGVASVMGNFRVMAYSITVGADTTMTVDTGMNKIDFLVSNLQSAETAGGIAITANQLAAGTAAAGHFAISGCTDGDDIHLVAFGT